MTVKKLREEYRENIGLTGLVMLGAPMTARRWLNRLCDCDLARFYRRQRRALRVHNRRKRRD
jgi:hypothetical protein